MFCDVCLFLLHYNTCMYENVALLIRLIVNKEKGVMNVMNHNLIVWFWEYTYDDCVLLNGSDVAFWHTHWDRLSRYDIISGSVAMLCYINRSGEGSMWGPLTWHNCISWELWNWMLFIKDIDNVYVWCMHVFIMF